MATVSSAAAPTKATVCAWFTGEVQQMMHGLGDCSRPLVESAALIAEITHDQMKILLYKASEVTAMRNGRFIGLEDFIFLLRKDKVKLSRLAKYLYYRDLKQSASRAEEEDTTSAIDLEVKAPPKKKMKAALDFINTIDHTGELQDIFNEDFIDDVKLERAMRADMMSRHCDKEAYLEFVQSRQTSFLPKFRSPKFKDWLMFGTTLDIKLNVLGYEIMAYMAYETVAQVVDLALLVRRDMQATIDDPLAHNMAPCSVNHDALMGANLEDRVASASVGGDGRQSPPGTPTSMTSPGHALILNSTAQGGLVKAKTKKKKDKGSTSAGKDLVMSQAIQPVQIREAIRRYGHTIGPFAHSSKLPVLPVKQNLLCL